MFLVLAYKYDWSVIPGSIGILLDGLRYSVLLSLVAAACAVILGMLVSLLRTAPLAPVRWLAFVYTQVFRAMSPYIYILWIYFGVAIATGLNLSPFAAGVASLTFLYSAYMSEVFRSSLAAVDRGQREAAYSLGLSRPAAFAVVILPQAYRIALPSLISLVVILFKDSSLVATIGAPDLMNATIQRVTVLNHSFELYTFTALLYIVVTTVFLRLAAILEQHLRRHLAV